MTQREFVLSRLCKYGKVSRNECLSNYISRLSAIIYDLKIDGFDFEAYYEPIIKNGVKIGEDYVYRLIKKPKNFDKKCKELANKAPLLFA